MNIHFRTIFLATYFLLNGMFFAQTNTVIQTQLNVVQRSKMQLEQFETIINGTDEDKEFAKIYLTNNNIAGFNLLIHSLDYLTQRGTADDLDFDQADLKNAVGYTISCIKSNTNSNVYISKTVVHQAIDRECLDTIDINEQTVMYEIKTILRIANLEELVYYDSGYLGDTIVFTMRDK